MLSDCRRNEAGGEKDGPLLKSMIVIAQKTACFDQDLAFFPLKPLACCSVFGRKSGEKRCRGGKQDGGSRVTWRVAAR